MFLDYILWFTQMAWLFWGEEWVQQKVGGEMGWISALKPMYCNESHFVCLKLIKAIASGWPRANKRQNASSCIDLGPPQHRRVLRAWSTFMATLGFLWILCTALGAALSLSLIPLASRFSLFLCISSACVCSFGRGLPVIFT